MKINEVKKNAIRNRIQIFSNRDSVANANIIKKLERQLRRLEAEDKE